MRTQRGLSFFGFIIIAGFVAAAAVVFFKVVPAYVEYFNVKKAVASVAKDQGTQPPAAIRESFDKHANISDIKAVSGKDLQIVPAGGKTSISVGYEKVVPVVANISLLFDFNVEAAGSGAE
ncbi:DUF4845 domain-containing protein [Jeongeupia wiesaeckerbachi]|uniref:DUF4845 domain-containing protein n=1 Tax=Jeongeupia wiesaeckerbachi TaxID=3051218 RepID=UPI003D800CC5